MQITYTPPPLDEVSNLNGTQFPAPAEAYWSQTNVVLLQQLFFSCKILEFGTVFAVGLFKSLLVDLASEHTSHG